MSIALITGASSGMGKDFARLFAKDKIDLVLVARRKNILDELAAELSEKYNINIKVFAKDLSEEKSAVELFEELQEQKIHVDYLVNNAGFGDYEDFIKQSGKICKEMIMLNIFSLTQLTQLFAQKMVEKGFGKILNTASIVAFSSNPKFAVYGATKAYVMSFTEALNYELKGTGVTATTLCPGATDTSFHEIARTRKALLTKLNIMSSEKTAQIGYKSMMKGKMNVIAGFFNNLLIFSARILPRSVVPYISEILSKNS